MSDYLWDPSAEPDPDIERLERLLRPLRSTTPAPNLRPGETPKTTRWMTARFLGPALAAAAAVLLMVGATWRAEAPQIGWSISSVSGDPRIMLNPGPLDSRASSAREGGQLVVGQAIVTDASSRARIEVESIGAVTIDVNSRLRLVESRDGRQRLSLDHGTLHAQIVAPPGQFVVDTPSARATDLGCVYTLHVDDDGVGLLSVQAGWVAFEFKGREVFVPSGASARTVPREGPGTPRYDDVDQAFQDSLDEVDYGGDAKRTEPSLDYVLTHARRRDAMSLWHLVSRVDADHRHAVVDALARLVPMPDGATRDAVMRLDRAALDAWWNALGLQDASWWRVWKREYPQ